MLRLHVLLCLSWTLVQVYHCDPIPEDDEDDDGADLDDDSSDLDDIEYVDDDENKTPDKSIEGFDLGNDMLEQDAAEDGLSSRSFFQHRLWPKNKKGLVKIPFRTGAFDKNVRQRFRKCIEMFKKNSCIRWVPWKNLRNREKKPHVKVVGRVPKDPHPRWSQLKHMSIHDCFASVGFPSAEYSYLMISKECTEGDKHTEEITCARSIAHEMMHVLGFYHEHQRRDRDCYIQISEPLTTDTARATSTTKGDDDISFPYDYNSIMHYRSKHFVPSQGNYSMNSEEPSKMDWIKLNWLYCGGQHARDLDPGSVQDHQRRLEVCKKRGMINV